MKILTLMRHGRAEPKHPRATDFDRPLHRRGVLEATRMAERLHARGPTPDLLICSSAARTMQTAEVFARVMNLPARKLLADDELYLAEPDELLNVIRATSNKVTHLMLVGHNPGLSSCANRLVRSGGLSEFDTGALCTLELPINGWADAKFGIGHNPRYDTPTHLSDAWS